MQSIKFGFLLIVLLSTVLTSKAQYYKATKGMTVRFDTAVVTDILTFRKETVKMKLGKQLIDSLTQYKENAKKEKDLLTQQLTQKDFHIQLLNERINNRDTTVSFLTEQLKTRREEPLIKKPAFIIVSVLAIIGLFK